MTNKAMQSAGADATADRAGLASESIEKERKRAATVYDLPRPRKSSIITCNQAQHFNQGGFHESINTVSLALA